jgi:fatty-acyl-CoA synthase
MLQRVDWETIADRTTAGMFLRQAERLGGRTLARHHDGEAWREVSWAETRTLVLRIAGHLVASGVGPGDRVAIIGSNSFDWLCCDLGVMAAGAVTVPVYASSPPSATRQVLDNSEARLAFTGDEALSRKVAPLRSVRMDGELRDWLARDPAPAARAEVERRLGRLSPDDLCTLVYTSGTTGEPKGVMLAHRCLVDMANACLRVFHVGVDDQTLSFLPYAHVFERVNGVMVAIAAGASIWISRGIDRVVDDLRECRPTLMVAVPRVYEKMRQAVMARVAEAPAPRRALFRWAVGQGRRRWRGQAAPLHALAERLVLSRLRDTLTGGRLRAFVSGGAALSGEIEDFFWSIGVEVLQGWGMTELSPVGTVCTLTPELEKLPAAERYKIKAKQGHAMYGVELKIVDPEGREVAHDGEARGELLVRGPWVISGYFEDDAASKAAFVDGWFRTGDVVTIDPHGYLQVVDRSKDVIKSGGEWISSIDVENAAIGHPDVAEAAVIGLPHPRWGERPLLIVTPRADRQPAKADILRYLEGHLAKWQLPDDVVFTTEIPHTATGKILKTRLRELYKAHALPAAE